jgi:hypothetical protein
MIFSDAEEPKRDVRFARWAKVGALVLGIILVIAGGLIVLLGFYFRASYVPSKIVDFHPADFPSKAKRRFFYSLGDELKNSDEISASAPTIFKGKITDFLVSPDETRIALVANGHLVMVGRDGNNFRDVAPVDSIYREPKPIGRSFFRDEHFQWTRDSKNLYLIKDQYYSSKGTQLYSEKGELWRYDVESGNLQLVLKPFPAYECFFGLKGIYFSVATPEGDLRLRYFDGLAVKDVGEAGVWAIPPTELQQGFHESPFFSFSMMDFAGAFAAGKQVEMSTDEKTKTQTLTIDGNPYLRMTEGNGVKEPFYCGNLERSFFLPGNRYFFFEAGCDNYDGQLLIDVQSRLYKRLPKDTRIYLTLNTETHPVFRVSCGGIMDW